MSPDQVSFLLNRIAFKINSSSSPNKSSVIKDLKSIISSIESSTRTASKPSKPSEMVNSMMAWYMVYEDTTSAEWPFVSFIAEGRDYIKICSFHSQDEVNDWTGFVPGSDELKEGAPDPDNTEIISVDEADELAAAPGMRLMEVDHF